MKSTSKKTTTETTTARKPGRPPEVRPEMIVQYKEQEYIQKDIVEAVKKARLDGGQTARIKSMKLYVKPEEGKVYYVINENEKGSIDI